MNTTDQTFSTSIDTSKLLQDKGGWETLRLCLNGCLHPVEDTNSIESRLDVLIGNLSDYDQNRILGMDAPQQEIDRLVKNVEQAFNLLNAYYKALKKSDLKFTFLVSNYVNSSTQDLDTKDALEIDEFVLEKSTSRQSNPTPDYQISPMHNGHKFGRGCNPNGLDDMGKEMSISVHSENFTPDALKAITIVFGDAMQKFDHFRNKLDRIQKQFNYQQQLQQVAERNRQSLVAQLAQVGSNALDLIQ